MPYAGTTRISLLKEAFNGCVVHCVPPTQKQHGYPNYLKKEQGCNRGVKGMYKLRGNSKDFAVNAVTWTWNIEYMLLLLQN